MPEEVPTPASPTAEEGTRPGSSTVGRTPRRRSKRWLYALVAAIVLLVAAFAAGVWVAGAGRRAAAKVAASYAEAYAGLDTTKDVPVLLPLYAEGAVLRDEATDRTHEGTAAIEGALNALLATPAFDLTIDRTLAGTDFALLFWTADGTRPGVGRVTQVKGVTVLEVSKGKITRETWYYDPAKAPF